MSDLVQVSVLCEICEKPAKFHCNTCGDVLCPNCKSNHQKSKASKYHTIVLYTEKVDIRHTSQLQCHYHEDNKCDVWCTTCQRQVCLTCMTSDCSGHEFKDIIAEVTQKRDSLVEELKELRTKSLPEWEERYQQVMGFTKSFHKDIDDVEKEMEDRAEELRRSIDIALSRNKESLKIMKVTGERALEGQSMILSEGMEVMKERTEELETLLANSDLNQILREQGENANRMVPLVHSIDAPRLIKPQIDITVLQDLIGNLTHSEEEKSLWLATGAPCDMIHQELSPLYIAEKKVGRNRRPLELMEAPLIISRIQTFSTYPYCVCVGNNEGCVAFDYSDDITHIDMNGDIKNIIKLPLSEEFSTTDKHMALTPTEDIVICEGKAVSLFIKNKKGYARKCTLFETDENLLRIYCLHNGDILALLPHSKTIVHYNHKDKSKRKLDSSLFWSLLPCSLAINKVNQDIYVCDQGEPKKVVALDQHYKLRYVYTGPDEGPFYPLEICTDFMGNVLITDMEYRVHILDKDGNFIQYLLTKENGLLYSPNTIDVDNDGYVWIGDEGPLVADGEGHINVFKHFE